MPRPAASRGVLIATILGSSMAFIDGTIVNVALPALQASLHATASNLQWVVEAYALTLASLLLLGGSLGDLYGRRKLFLAGVLIFALASAWCGLAGTIQMLVAARAVQGIGAALLVPGSLSLISASFPEDTRGQAIGTWSAFTAITTAFGPVLGGWMVEHVSWRAVFFINVPIAAVAAWITLSSVPESRNESMPRKLDWPGSVLACTGARLRHVRADRGIARRCRHRGHRCVRRDRARCVRRRRSAFRCADGAALALSLAHL